MLGEVLMASPQHVMAQDSLLTKDFEYLKLSDSWLTSPNAAGLNRLTIDHLTDAQVGIKYETGGFVDYYQAAKALSIGADIESYYRLSKHIVMYGRMGYDNFSGRDMTGSAFINPTHMPFDIIERTLDNKGRKHKDTYYLTGAVSGEIYKDITIGARIDYTAANYAKYKDLRHKNNLMDLTVTAGVYVPIGCRVQMGANYYYRRSSEGVRFSIYGNSDLIYKSIVSYGTAYGKAETFGEYGYTDSNREMPLFNEYQGGGVQLSWDITPWLSWYNNFSFNNRDGYYGKKSSYTISYNQFDGNQFEYSGRFSISHVNNRHDFNIQFSTEKLTDYNNTYREVEDPVTSARYYEYYTPVKLSKKTWTSGGIAYTGYYGINDMTTKWIVNGGVNLMQRKQTMYEYPYYRKQNIRSTELFARGEHNIPLKPGILTAALGMSYKKGSGEIYKDGVMAAPSDKQTAPAEMTAFLHREYQWLTAPQYAIDAMAKYAFIFPKTRMKTYAKAGICYRRTSESDEYLEGKSHTTLSFAIGCTF